jgi:DNA-directed RNA polymerase specialized sigma24 family protein
MDFADFYRNTSPRTLRYAYGLTGDLQQAQDVTQEAYVRASRAWRRTRSIAPRRSSCGWMIIRFWWSL